MTLFFFSFHGRLEHFNLFALFYAQIKKNRCIQRKAGPVCQSSQGRRRSHSHLIAKVIEPILRAMYICNVGMDKVVEILMRGRDHGLPGYVAWRQFCGLSPVRNFTDLGDIVSTTNIVLLASVYSSVDDIDLFTGALAETPLKGAE